MKIQKTELQLKVINTIKELRENDNKSQAFVSDILESKSDGLIGNIESPKERHKYTLKQLNILCKHFNYPIEKLFLGEESLELSASDRISLLIDKIVEYGEYGE